ncbi:hypothetical protein GGF46_000753 [Coemansia sp. RSA 552]|nr:hypothetical protein GGF46_000753 [Coemansia sp. RSA 552]
MVAARRKGAAPPKDSSRPAGAQPAARSEQRAVEAGGPPVPVLLSLLIGLVTTTILASSMARLGPQYLEPIYGNVLPYLGFFHGTVVSMVLGGILGSAYWRRVVLPVASSDQRKAGSLTIDTKTGRALGLAFDIVSIITALAPLRARYLFRWSDALGPMWGPLATQSMLAYPVFAAGGFVVTISAARVAHNPQSPARQAAVFSVCLGAVALLIWVGQRFSSAHRGCYGLLLNAGYAALSSVMVKLLTGHQENIDMVDALQKERSGTDSSRVSRQRDGQLRKLRFVPAVAFVFFALTTLFTEPACTNGLGTSGISAPGYHMLYRNESITGWVTVADEDNRNIRVMRSGHSLIGGMFKQTHESIFEVFYFADAVRLVRGRSNGPINQFRETVPRRAGIPEQLTSYAFMGDGSERALQIGLGVGISAGSLHLQNVRVDVVELDPAVHDAAEKLFNLPRNLNAVYIMDGRRFIDEAPTGTYDYIVHDVFTGGSVPSSLFSESAVAQLRRILRDDGVLAMNVVALPSDTRTLAHIAYTLHTAFSHVRCFAESTEDPDTITNMMFFASPKPIEFDLSPDVLRALNPRGIRRHALAGMLGKELDIDAMLDDPQLRPITDAWNPLPEWLVLAAIKHWHAVRGVLPTEYWLNY